MAEVMVGARLAACEVPAGMEDLARRLARLFLRETSRFRAYRESDEQKQTIDRLLSPADNTTDGPWLVRHRLPGSDTLEGRAGETTYSVSMGFRAAYIPQSERWRIGVATDDPTWVEVTDVGAGKSGPKQPLRFPWGLWDLVVRLMLWESVGYKEATLHGPMWQTGSEGITEGLAEQYMEDLLEKLMEVRPLLGPGYASLGEEYGFKDANLTFRVHQRLPRLSWVNIFGPSYVAKYGRQFLLRAPGYRVEELEDGSIYYQLTECFFQNPEHTDAVNSLMEQVRSYFGANPLTEKVAYRPTYPQPASKQLGRGGNREKGEEKNVDPMREAGACVSTFRDSFGITLGYTPESLKELDRVISEAFPETEQPTQTTLLNLGSYVGEVVRRNVGGRWRIVQPFADSSIVGLLRVEALWPYQRVQKRFEEGKASSLYDWYRALVQLESAPH